MSNYDQMIDAKDGSISREIFVDDGIYPEELEKIFARMWLFVGHESLIPKPGDFFSRAWARNRCILCRDRDRKSTSSSIRAATAA